jgi:ABC-type Fe3+-hydroxamate transport system substrate-binding protein
MDRPTRREYVTYGGALLGSGILAGCGGSEGDSGSTPTETTAVSDGAEAATAAPETAETTTVESELEPRDGPYTVEMSPMGEVRFEERPERVFSVLSHHTDMALSVGRHDDLVSDYAPGYTDSLMAAFTPRLEGVEFDLSELFASWNPPKEQLYELDSDIHLADPASVLTMGNWSQDDIAEIADNVAPWFGNTLSDQHTEPPASYSDYRYYTLWEIFGKVASALDERARYRALRSVYDDLRATVDEGLPAEGDRPSVAMVLPSTSDDSMWAYKVNAPGYHASHIRPLGTLDAMDGVDVDNGAQVDAETLVAADPDILVILGGLVDYHDIDGVRADLEDDPVASQVTAVQEDRVYPQGTRHQGPLVNLFQLEASAKQCYPEAFGAWPEDDGNNVYPEIPESERLFDYDRVASIIRGDFE